MRFLRQSTAATVVVGPFPSPTTGLAVAGLASQSGRLIKNGTASAFTPASWTEDSGEHYIVGLGTGDTDTIGRLRVSFNNGASYLPTWEDFSVLAAAVYDVIFGTVAPSTHTAAAVAALVAADARLANLDATVSSRSTYAGGDTAGTTTLLARLTAGRATNLDNLDAAVSTRSTYAGADTAGTTTLLARLTATRAGLLDNLDAAVSTRLAAADYAAPPTAAAIDAALSTAHGAGAWDVAGGGGGITITDVQTALTNQGYTIGRAGNLDNADVAISTRSTYAGGPVASVTAPVTVDYTQAGPTFRDLSAVLAPTLGDVLAAAYAWAVGSKGVAGTAYTIEGPGGVVVRTYVLDDAANPTSLS